MKNKHTTLFPLLIFFQILKESIPYNKSIPFNFTYEPSYCYQKDFILSKTYRPFSDDIYPIKGCNSDERNQQAQQFGNDPINHLTNITFEPRLDYFFNKDEYPPADRDPPTSMTFKTVSPGSMYHQYFFNKNYKQIIQFGRCDDYHPIRNISRKTGESIQFTGKKATLPAKFKIVPLQSYEGKEYNFSNSDYEIADYDGIDFKATFDGYELDISGYANYLDQIQTNEILQDDTLYALITKVYDLPRMKVQGLFQYRYSAYNIYDGSLLNNIKSVYTVDTRNVFFQNISMFYNQRVNVTNEGLEPTGEDSGFWVKTTCNIPQMATIMVDYYFFDTIHRMQSYGFEFGDRFQLRIHTPFYRKTLVKEYSLFRYQWPGNSSYPKPRVFIHPISKYKEYCDTYKNCEKFNYDEWSTDPKFTKYIIDVKNEIVGNEIRINFTELEEIYKADGFHRPKLVINVNNTMAPPMTQYINGLWAELYDTVTNDWVMKTKTIMDEVHGYLDTYEQDPFRNFYLTCEIPDNITKDDVYFMVKKYGVLRTSHIYIRLDVWSQGITKMYPPRFNVIIKLPPDLFLTNVTFLYTFQYYIIGHRKYRDYLTVFKDIRETGIGDGSITDNTFDIKGNQLNISELHPNFPNGDDSDYYSRIECFTPTFDYEGNPINFTENRHFLFYIYELNLVYNTNNTQPIELTVYQVRYVPHHPKKEINRGLHRWNQHHAGMIPSPFSKYPLEQIYDDNKREGYRYYVEADEEYSFYWYNGGYVSAYISNNDTIGYKGPDCVFNFIGGSNLRNKSCEFWNGLIPNMPFTNYARDVIEEHIAYQTLYEQTFRVNTTTMTTMSTKWMKGYESVINSECLIPGHYNNLVISLGTTDFHVEREYEDGEIICDTTFIPPPCCSLYLNRIENFHIYPHNIHEYPQEFFGKMVLPENLTIIPEYIGKITPCYSEVNSYSRRYLKTYPQDYICFCVNSTTIFIFNSKSQVGRPNWYFWWDFTIVLDKLYVNENSSLMELYSGYFEWGFYDNPFVYVNFPGERGLVVYHHVTKGSLNITRKNETNDGYSRLTLSPVYKDYFNYEYIFNFYFEKDIQYLEYIRTFIKAKAVDLSTCFYFRHCYIYDLEKEEQHPYIGVILQTPPNARYSFEFMPYYNETFQKNSYYINALKPGLPLNIKIYLNISNPRSFRPSKLHVFLYNVDYACVFHYYYVNITNKIPQYFYNMSVTPNSFITGDRAVYKFNYITYMRATLAGDILEFKTSWKTKYVNNEAVPDKEGYYINRFVVDKNYSNELNMTLIANFVLNPETLDTEYIKDIRLNDCEGYLIAVCNDTIPIKMKKIAGFKRSEISTENTTDDNKYNINIDLVPEILIRKDDKLRLKFSSVVSLEEYPECSLEVKKGINILNPDFKCEIDKDNNEIILNNAFDDIGESLLIFEYLNSTALTEQQMTFSLKNVPMYSKSNEQENIYSIEIETENSEGFVTQKNLLGSTVIFKCDGRCKTCNESTPSECLSCNKDYPYYYPPEKYCHKFCPKENYYSKENKEGIIECLKCESPCQNCIGNATNCTLCLEGFFMEDGKCVEKCGDDKGTDYILRRCYSLIKKNITTIIDRTIQVNISIPEPYPVYIERNICMIDGI